MASVSHLQELYHETLIQEMIEKTKTGTMIWSDLGGTQFMAKQNVDDVAWEFFITKNFVGNATCKFHLEVKKNSAPQISMEHGPMSRSEKDCACKELYDLVEIIVLDSNRKVRETINIIQNLK